MAIQAVLVLVFLELQNQVNPHQVVFLEEVVLIHHKILPPLVGFLVHNLHLVTLAPQEQEAYYLEPLAQLVQAKTCLAEVVIRLARPNLFLEPQLPQAVVYSTTLHKVLQH